MCISKHGIWLLGARNFNGYAFTCAKYIYQAQLLFIFVIFNQVSWATKTKLPKFSKLHISLWIWNSLINVQETHLLVRWISQISSCFN